MWLVGLNDIYNLSKFMEEFSTSWQTLTDKKVSCRSGDVDASCWDGGE